MRRKILEMPGVPGTPIIKPLQRSAGEFPESASHSLPGLERDDIKAYRLSIDVLQVKVKPAHAYKEMPPLYPVLMKPAPDKEYLAEAHPLHDCHYLRSPAPPIR
jgi:hypothetical protein